MGEGGAITLFTLCAIAKRVEKCKVRSLDETKLIRWSTGATDTILSKNKKIYYKILAN